MARYSTGSWRSDTTARVEDQHGNVYFVETEVADLTDSHGGHVYRDGAYRVDVHLVQAKSREHPVLSDRTRSGLPARKNFKGETAWSDAARYANDVELALRMGRKLR